MIWLFHFLSMYLYKLNPLCLYFKLFFHSSKDLWSGNSSSTSSIVGLAYMSDVCGANKYAIVEEIGAFAYLGVNKYFFSR